MFESFWLFHCGYFHIPEALVAHGGSRRFIRLPLMGAAAYHAERGLILIDAPYGREGPKNAGALMGGLLGLTVQRFERAWGVVPRIEQLGFRASDVHHLLMTHLHVDHTGGMKELSHATFHTSHREWSHATSLRGRDALRQGYIVGDFRALGSRVATFDLPASFSREHPGHDVFGDGSARALSLPGHSPGHTGYLLEMSDGRRIFYMGDAVFSTAQVSARQPFAVFVRNIAHDLTQATYTLSELQRYHTSHPDTLLLCAHDIGLGEQCMEGPISI